MTNVSACVRQAMLAALFLLPASASAEVQAIIDSLSSAIKVLGLEAMQRQGLIENPRSIFLQNRELAGVKSMALSVTEIKDTLVIQPRFQLMPGSEYHLRLDLGANLGFETTLSIRAADAAPPRLLWHSPNASMIPENTLRLYLMFSEPMAMGQMRDAIRIERSDGSIVESPFLNLGAELWDPKQRRLTLLFDPGRIKRGVGPNASEGAPLRTGERYSLVISGSVESAIGKRLGEDIQLPLIVGPAERRALDPANWDFVTPPINTHNTLQVLFDRVMDKGTALRLITVVDHFGKSLGGRVESDGAQWLFTPNETWKGNESLRIHPRLEDVAGNTQQAPFDAGPGTIGTAAEGMALSIY